MATSYNRWPVGTREALGVKSYDVPGPSTVKLALLPAAAPILLYFAAFWDANVEDIDVSAAHKQPDDWGHAYRAIRGQSAGNWSNHASGTAMDINATQYPRGTAHMSASKKNKIRAELKHINDISKKVNGHDLVNWGGDYTRSPIDQMHVELAPGTSAADVRRVMTAIEAEKKPKINVRNVKMAFMGHDKLRAAPGVLRIQKALRAKGYLKGYIPGRAGGATKDALLAFLKKRHGKAMTINEMTVADIRALVGPTFNVY